MRTRSLASFQPATRSYHQVLCRELITFQPFFSFKFPKQAKARLAGWGNFLHGRRA